MTRKNNVPYFAIRTNETFNVGEGRINGNARQQFLARYLLIFQFYGHVAGKHFHRGSENRAESNAIVLRRREVKAKPT